MKIYIEKEDLELAQKNNNMIRLKDFADIVIHKNIASISSITPNEDLPIIHWLDSNHSEKATLETTNEDNLELIDGLLEISSITELKQTLQLERIGYAKLNNKNELVFLHN